MMLMDFFDQARRIAAAQGPVPNPHPSSSSTTFTGTGRLLSGESAPVAPEQPVSVVHNIVFWRNGFTVNDGPLRKFDDPENKVFLERLFKSEVPKELEQADRRSPVHVNLIRRVEDCPEPEIRQVSFQGTGRTLGSSSSRTEPTPGSTASTPLQSASTPLTSIVINDSLPSGPIQLRLADGTRMVAYFNHHHTVADIRSFIDAARPGGSRSYQLQTVGFPPKLLHDASLTIEEAGLFNSVVIQKI